MAAGLAATGVMILLELAARSRWGYAGLLDWQINQATWARVTKRPEDTLVVPGLGLHFLHGLLAGLVFVLVMPLFPSGSSAVALGLGYGLVLFALTLLVFRPITRKGLGSRPQDTAAAAFGLCTHLVFGAVLAVLVA